MDVVAVEAATSVGIPKALPQNLLPREAVETLITVVRTVVVNIPLGICKERIA
jgi:hypothetical protein